MTHLFQILPSVTNRGPHSKERYFLEIRHRYLWLLSMGGERVLLLKKKYYGTRCPNFDQVRKTNEQHNDTICYGTGWVGGYFKPVEIVCSLMTGGPEYVPVQDNGLIRIYNPHSWTIWEPRLTSGDIIIRKNNQRFIVVSTYARRWKSYVTRQDFELSEVERNHIVYQFPL